MLRAGIDIGGTFTDFVIYDTEKPQISTFKLLTDASNPALTVLQGLEQSVPVPPKIIIHGSTVATNALLERKGARTALITTLGFKDVLQIGRQNRASLYDLAIRPSPSLVPSDLRFEVEERVDYQGNISIPLDPAQVSEILMGLGEKNVESVAVCLLFSFLYPQHEQVIAEFLKKSAVCVSISSDILPEFREYERTSTTVVNAYVSPILDKYLSKLESSLPGSNLQIMQSNGGMISASEAKRNGARCVFSGPAGGILGAQFIVKSINKSETSDKPIHLITFDMGGTSTDVSLIDASPSITTDASVAGCPIHLPMLDIHTIGAGGGSIAYVDPGGSLRVGPESAGANPGPACYGKGNLPTVTDANLVLGRLLPDYFLGGKMQLDPARASRALERLGSQLGLTAVSAAKGVIEVVNAQMERALRLISVERGHDPRDFDLFSFGGAGGLHALQLARNMDISRVIISKYASTLSALGMLASNVKKDFVKTVMLLGTRPIEDLTTLFDPMIKRGNDELSSEGFLPGQIEIQTSLDLRYEGQSYELSLPCSDHYASDFNRLHQATYGYCYLDKAIEIVNLRVVAIGKVEPIQLPRASNNLQRKTPRAFEYRRVELPGGSTTVPVYDYEQLSPSSEFTGPCLIVSTDTTILVNEGDQVSVDSYLNLLIEVDTREA